MKTTNNNQVNEATAKVLCQIDQRGIATVTLNNPEKHNAFDDGIIGELTNIFTQLAENHQVRVVVLASNGKSFSAGADLGWMKRMADYSYQENLNDANALAQMLKALNFLPQTTIAQIQGAAFGGAVGLASCCDIVLAAEQASFCLSEVKLGLIPATISPYVVQAIGLKAARRYFQTAERFSAKKAEQIGLVDEVVTLAELSNTVENMINTILANGPHAVKEAKQLAFSVAHREIDELLINDTCERIAAIRVSNEGQEGLASFFEKRVPSWQIASINSAKKPQG